LSVYSKQQTTMKTFLEQYKELRALPIPIELTPETNLLLRDFYSNYSRDASVHKQTAIFKRLSLEAQLQVLTRSYYGSGSSSANTAQTVLNSTLKQRLGISEKYDDSLARHCYGLSNPFPMDQKATDQLLADARYFNLLRDANLTNSWLLHTLPPPYASKTTCNDNWFIYLFYYLRQMFVCNDRLEQLIRTPLTGVAYTTYTENCKTLLSHLPTILPKLSEARSHKLFSVCTRLLYATFNKLAPLRIALQLKHSLSGTAWFENYKKIETHQTKEVSHKLLQLGLQQQLEWNFKCELTADAFKVNPSVEPILPILNLELELLSTVANFVIQRI
jgi:hypothetical protein